MHPLPTFRTLFLACLVAIPAAAQAQTADAAAATPAAEPAAAAAEAAATVVEAAAPAAPAAPEVTTAVAPVAIAEPVKVEPKAEPAPRGGLEFVDSRLTFSFCDDDLTKGAGESTPSSPAANFLCSAQNTQFFDNYETKTSGFDNFSNLVIYKKLDTHYPGLTVDAALALRFNQGALMGSSQQLMRDESSYIRLSYRPAGWDAKDGLQFIGFPISSDRFRLGYSYRITWGGNSIFGGRLNPGAKLQLRKGPVLGYVGVKTALVLNPKINEEESNYALLGGASFDPFDGLRLEANGGFFERGKNPIQAVLGAPMQTFGGSFQVTYAHREKARGSIDFSLYTNDPAAPQNFFRPEEYPGGLSYVVSAEATTLGTTLADPETTRSGSTTVQQGFAGDVQVRVKLDHLRVHFTGMIRDLAYLTVNQGSVTPNVAMPADLAQTAEFFVATGVDYYLPEFRLTPGITFGLQQPASFTSDKLTDIIGNNPPMADLGRRTVVVREDPSFAGRILQDILPNNCGAGGDEVCEAKPIYGTKVSLRYDIGPAVAANAEAFVNFNPNRVRFQDDEFGVAQRIYDSPTQLGFNTALSVRF